MIASSRLTSPADGDELSSAAPGVAHDNNSMTPWQHPLPVPWRMSPAPERTRFAHPAERELARILTFHGVRWVYEPTNFVLERDVDGSPSLCFNPDFYLPDHNRYLELTIMRQAHVTRKNRKLRLLRERFPTVDAHILYRRDFERLADRYRVQSTPDMAVVGAPLYTALQIEARVRAVAAACVGRDAPEVVISLGSGSARFAGELVAGLRDGGVDPAIGEMSLAGVDMTSAAKRLRIQRGPRVALKRRRILLVTDIVSTGLSAGFAIRWLVSRGAGPVEVATMLDRPAARILRLPLRASAFTIDDTIVAGHGIALGGRLGELPDIVEVHRDSG